VTKIETATYPLIQNYISSTPFFYNVPNRFLTDLFVFLYFYSNIFTFRFSPLNISSHWRCVRF